METLDQAVVLSAGKGTRLHGLTQNFPKVMLPVNGKPLLAHHVEWLKRYGIRRLYINLHHAPECITEFFGDGRKFGVEIVYSAEEELRGTAGALNGFRQFLQAPFVVHYGDVYADIDLGKMLRFHQERRSAGTLAVHPSSHPEDSDIVRLDGEGRVLSVHHKPGSDQFGNLGNAACYIVEPVLLRYLPADRGPYDFIQDVFPKMLEAAEPLYGYDTDEILQDMGTPQRYEQLHRKLEAQ